MARPLSNPESHRNGINGSRTAHTQPSRHDALPARSSELPQHEVGAADLQEIEILRDENIQLRELIAELERHLEEISAEGDSQALLAQQRELEALLEEKSQHIRQLHIKVQELDLAVKNTPQPVKLPHEDELLRMQEELDREQRQLKEDEESMMQQMREMEVQMARERAELARQRTDLQRLHGEIRHEVELAARDATLRERLAPLQRRAQEIMNRRGSSPGAPGASAQHPAQHQPTPQPAETQAPKKDSGLLRRLFR